MTARGAGRTGVLGGPRTLGRPGRWTVREEGAVSERTVRLLGDPVLRGRAAEVTAFDDHLEELVDRMFAVMDAAPGAGLAAPQIGVPLRVFTFHVDGVRGHVVNPRCLPGIETGLDQEGCLSVPGVYALRRRATTAVVRGTDVRGRPLEVSGHGYLARCLQHETDHLDGTLFMDGLPADARAQVEREIAAAPWNDMTDERPRRRAGTEEMRRA